MSFSDLKIKRIEVSADVLTVELKHGKAGAVEALVPAARGLEVDALDLRRRLELGVDHELRIEWEVLKPGEVLGERISARVSAKHETRPNEQNHVFASCR